MNNFDLMCTNENAHKGGIMCMDSDEYFIYTGDKDNIVKSWQFKELSKDQIAEQEIQKTEETEEKSLHDLEEKFGKYKVEFSSYMIGHTSQVNSICTISDDNCSIFSGGNDKSLKLWRR